MAEILAIFGAPTLLEAAGGAIGLAWHFYNDIQERNAQCKVIIDRCQELLAEVVKANNSNQLTDVMRENLRFLERACESVRAAMAFLSGKNFAWRLLHQDSIAMHLSDAEEAVAFACSKFNISAHLASQQLQIDLAAARERDHLDLVSYLQAIAESDQKILDALQNDGRERRQLQELVVALTKHVQNLSTRNPSPDERPTDAFARAASMALQRLSNHSSPIDIPRWSVTSLEVTFDRNDEQSCIGRGGFGKIYRGEWNGQVVAVKEMHWEDARGLTAGDLKDIRREINIWSQLTHPNVLPFYCACLEASQPFMVTKLCSYGSALEYLRASPHANRVLLLDEIALGMNYLHIQGIIHADLKASNVLIADDGTALLADFGLSQFQDQVSSRRSNIRSSNPTREGTLRWMAPERLDGELPGKPSDVYSFAITAWELFTGQVPFSQVPDRALVRKVVDKQERPQRPPLMESDLLWGLIQQCWDPETTVRPGFDVIHIRLKPLIGCPNMAFNVPPTPMTELSFNQPVQLERSSKFLTEPITNLTVPSPTLPSVLLPSMETLVINDSAINNSNDKTVQAQVLSEQLVNSLLVSEKIRCLEAIEILTHSVLLEEGRAAICAQASYFEEFVGLLTNGSSDAKEKTISCLVNLAWDGAGKTTVLGFPRLFPPLVSLLWYGSSVAKTDVARCLGRIASIRLDTAQCKLLLQPGIIQALRNMLSTWSLPQEKEQAVKTLVCLSCNEEGRRVLLADHDMTPTLLNLISHGTADAVQNAVRCLANMSSTTSSQEIMARQPNIVNTIGDLLKAGTASEVEQAMRFFQLMTYTETGQKVLIATPSVIANFSRLLTHESPTVQKYTAACCRNLCHTAFGVNCIFTQRGLPYALKVVLFSGAPEAREYALAAFIRIIHHCMDADTPLDALPVRHDRQGFLLGLEELFYHPPAQERAAACLRHLCGDLAQVSRQSSALNTWGWLSDITYRPSLLLALANPNLESPQAVIHATRCLAVVAQLADDQMKQSFLSQSELLTHLATTLASGPTGARGSVAQCLAALASNDAGQTALKGHEEIMSTLRNVHDDPFTLKVVKAEVEVALRALTRPLKRPARSFGWSQERLTLR